MLQQLYADVYCWSERHGEAEASYNWNSFAIRINQANVLALVDPLPLVLPRNSGREGTRNPDPHSLDLQLASETIGGNTANTCATCPQMLYYGRCDG